VKIHEYSVTITSTHRAGQFSSMHRWTWLGGDPETIVPDRLYRDHVVDMADQYGAPYHVQGDITSVTTEVTDTINAPTMSGPHREVLTPQRITGYLTPEPTEADVVHANAGWDAPDGTPYTLTLTYPAAMFAFPGMTFTAVRSARDALAAALAAGPGHTVKPADIGVIITSEKTADRSNT
jgi:hypothetical protein